VAPGHGVARRVTVTGQTAYRARARTDRAASAAGEISVVTEAAACLTRVIWEPRSRSY
jgi:hypothetical protein